MPQPRTGNRPGSPGSPGSRVFTIPNALSLFRLLLVPVVVALLVAGRDYAAAALFVLAAATDVLDGWIARSTASGTSRLGEILDPLADRLMLSGAAVVLAFRDLLPVWAVAVLVGRDALALLGGLAFGGRVKVNRMGKAATAVLVVSVALVVLGLNAAGQIAFYAGIALSLAAGVLYAGRVLGLAGPR
jgi:cardiolipin synthase (CMP-forming)